jgi:hypothetical protein
MQFIQQELRCEAFDTALLFASYESRSVKAGALLAEKGFRGRVYVLYCDDVKSTSTENNVQFLSDLFGAQCRVLPVSYCNPTQIIVQTKQLDDVNSLFIDTSAFTRENLFAFLWARKFGVDRFPNIVFGYTAPDEYGDWLSSDYGRAHNIVGFGGTAESSAKRHLICCVGYESDRALAVIEALEPSKVTLVFGSTPTRQEFLARNKDVVTEVLGNSNFDVREIDVKNPKKCLSDLKEIKSASGTGVSVHIAPFNTKLSCLSVFALWLEDHSIRVWNALPNIYNIHNYSSGATMPECFGVAW